MAERKEGEAKQAMAIGPAGESPLERRVELKDSIQGTGNVSSDGTMVLVREEG